MPLIHDTVFASFGSPFPPEESVKLFPMKKFFPEVRPPKFIRIYPPHQHFSAGHPSAISFHRAADGNLPRPPTPPAPAFAFFPRRKASSRCPQPTSFATSAAPAHRIFSSTPRPPHETRQPGAPKAFTFFRFSLRPALPDQCGPALLARSPEIDAKAQQRQDAVFSLWSLPIPLFLNSASFALPRLDFLQMERHSTSKTVEFLYGLR